MAGIEVVQREIAFRGWAQLSVLHFKLADGAIIRREVEDHGEAACVLPFDARRRVAILVRQFRAPVNLTGGGDDLLEAIAGIVDEADPRAAAIRESWEEAGLRLGAVSDVTTLYSMPGISTERVHLYFAEYSESDRIGRGGGNAHEQENITVIEMTLADLARLADSGELRDMKTFALVQTLRLRRPELFI